MSRRLPIVLAKSGVYAQPGVHAWKITVLLVLTVSATALIAQQTPRGDAVRGKALYEASACADCHRLGEKGSRVGPDLSAVGDTRTPEQLHRAIVAPDEEVLAENRNVRVVLKDGTAVIGRILNQDAFSIQMLTAAEQLASYARSDLREHAIIQKGLMPSYRRQADGSGRRRHCEIHLAVAAGRGRTGRGVGEEHDARADRQRGSRAAELADLQRQLLESPLQRAESHHARERRLADAQVGLASEVSRQDGDDAAGCRRRPVLGPEQRSRSHGRGDRPDVLDVPVSRSPGVERVSPGRERTGVLGGPRVLGHL